MDVACGAKVRCLDGKCFSSRVKVAIAENQGMMYCKYCGDPSVQGSYGMQRPAVFRFFLTRRGTVDVWEAHYHPEDYVVHGGWSRCHVTRARCCIV